MDRLKKQNTAHILEKQRRLEQWRAEHFTRYIPHMWIQNEQTKKTQLEGKRHTKHDIDKIKARSEYCAACIFTSL